MVMIELVLVRAVLERVQESGMPTMADCRIVEVLVSVERKPGLAARTLGLEPHTHTETGHSNSVADSKATASNTVTHSKTDTGGNSREQDTPGQLQSQCQWGCQCRFGILSPGLKTTTKGLRWTQGHTGTKQFLLA